MSNRKKWTKCIEYKGYVKRDKIYNSYWIRKFLNKLAIHGKKQKMEVMLYNIFNKLKKFMRPIFFFYKILKKLRWVLTTHLKRMGKYFHSLVTYNKSPNSYGHSLLKLKKALYSSKFQSSYVNTLFSELQNIKFFPKDSYSLHLKKEKLLLIDKNRAYTHYRWR